MGPETFCPYLTIGLALIHRQYKYHKISNISTEDLSQLLHALDGGDTAAHPAALSQHTTQRVVSYSKAFKKEAGTLKIEPFNKN